MISSAIRCEMLVRTILLLGFHIGGGGVPWSYLKYQKKIKGWQETAKISLRPNLKNLNLNRRSNMVGFT